MPKNKKTNYSYEDYFNLPNPGLRSYFGNVERGSSDIITSPWIHGDNEQKLKQTKAILNEWMSHLESLKTEWPSLFEYESDMAAKVGPMSIMAPLKARLHDIDAYYDLINKDAAPVSQQANLAALAKFKRARGLTLRSQQRVVDLMKKSTNSGSPYFIKRRNVVNKTVPVQVLHDEQILNGRSWKYCAVLGWRGQEGGPNIDDVKQRVVWMFPFGINVLELQLYQPLIEALQAHSDVPAWVSMDAVDLAITKLFDTKDSKDLVICTDFSKFDQHFNQSLQDSAKTILTSILTPTKESHDWLEQVYPIKYDIPLSYNYGKIRFGKHGMGSGSGGTNADETLAHTALQFESAILNKTRLNPYSQCLGDDGILSYPGITADKVMRSYTTHGLEMNASKQYESTHDCTYLRRWHHTKYRVNGVCVGVYSTARALGRLCMQERYYDPEVWGPKMVALRQLSILENVKWHPLRDEFAEFCMKRDKYDLGLKIPGFLDNIEREASKAIEYMPDFLGYTRSLSFGERTGISSWWIVNYLKSKR